MKLTRELFVILESEGTFVVYAPLKGVVMRVNGGAVGLLKKIGSGYELLPCEKAVFEDFRSKGIVVDQQERIEVRKHTIYAPDSVTLMPTYDCNLRCTYCYARGGEDVLPDMIFGIAKSAIDFVIKNAKACPKKQVHLGFHGGGEPFYPRAMPLVMQATAYFKSMASKSGLKASTSVATNGTLNGGDLEWVIKNFTQINVSIDGPEDIQNRQRPMKGGGKSYDLVLKTIKELEMSKCKYGLRATITSESVNRMPEIVEFFHSISPSLKSFHMEPLFECGRCRTSDEKTPDKRDFLENFLNAVKKAKTFGVKLHYSGAKLDKISDTFCGAAGTNFFVGPEGLVTACLEVSRIEDDRADVFIIGKYVPERRKFKFDREKIKNLSRRTVFNIPYCKDCFAKFNCAGDCLAKSYALSRDLCDTSKMPRCEINQGILLKEMVEQLQ
ncbi:MAG: radical SAM protein [Nanoarchaeota archaeon]